MLKPGSMAPDFVLPNEDGVDISLSGLLRSGPLVLYFYPADFTLGCTREACSIRDIHEDIRSVGLQIIGISPQDAESHRKFRAQNKLPFTLLSDPEKNAIRKFDVDGPFGIGVRRVTYLINERKKIEAALQADVLIDMHREFIEKAIHTRVLPGR